MKLVKIGREERRRRHRHATMLYRLGQGLQHLGLVASLNAADRAEVERWLPLSAVALFYTMSRADQQHSLRVCRGLQAEGYMEQDLLVAALLHDVGKAQGRVPFWTRPAIVLGKLLVPHWLRKSIVQPETLATDGVVYWKRALSYAWWHAEIGAELAARAGVSAQTVLYIRAHHQSEGPAAVLHRVDEVS